LINQSWDKMKRNSKINTLSKYSFITLFILSASCTVAPLNSPDNQESIRPDLIPEPTEAGYQLQALTVEYLKRKLNKFIANDGTKLLKEVNFSKFKHQTTMRTITFSDPVILQGLLDNTEIRNRIAIDASFAAYIDSLIPEPGTTIAIPATNITTTSFTADWNAVDLATRYVLVLDDVEIEAGKNTSYDVSGLPAGSSHSYYVKVYREGVASQSSNIISVVTLPAAPTAYNATEITASSFKANWTAVTGADNYTLELPGVGTFDAENSLSFNVTGLTGNTDYTYTVKANNTSGISTASNVITVRTVSGVPAAAPATLITENSFTANWVPIEGITSYTLEVEGKAPVIVENANSYNVIGLSGNTSYTYTVKANNSSGGSASSNPVSVTTLPSAPTANAATDITETTFTANWTATPDFNYTLTVPGKGSFNAGNTNSYPVTGLSGNSDYTYYVTASNATGSSTDSGSINVKTLPQAPAATDATFVTQNSFTANWNTVSGLTYTLEVPGKGTFDAGSSGSYTVTGLNSNTNYTYYVTAANSTGNSAVSNIISVKTDFSLTDGLMAYYPFSGNTNDTSGNGNNGSGSNLSLTTDRFNNTNSAYTFNGSNSQVSIPDSQTLNPSKQISISLWVKQGGANGSNSYQAVISKGLNNTVDDYGIRMSREFRMFGELRTDAFYNTYSDTQSQVTAGQWYMLTMTYNGSNLLFYENTAQKGNSPPVSGNINDGSLAVLIGNNGGEAFKGVIDDVRIYNRALTQAEINTLYHMNNWP
jgi:hypothetical protein